MWAICDNRPSAKTRRSGYAQLHVCLRFFAVSDCLGARTRMKRRQVLLHESWSVPKKDKSSVVVLLGDSGTAGAVGQLTSQCAVSNCAWNEFEESSSVSCHGSTLENNKRELTSTSNESVIVANTACYSDKDGT